MKKRTVIASITAFAISMSLSACGSTPTASNNSDSTRIEELEQRIEELETENKELKVQLNNSDSTDSNQQSTNEADSLLQAIIESPEISGVCGADLTWYYQNGVLAITGTGEMTNYNKGIHDKRSPWYDIKGKIGWVIIDDGVTTIGEDAFSRLGTLSKVELPNTLTDIGSDAFDECSNLKQITIPNSLENLSSIYIFGNNYDIEIMYNGNIYTYGEFQDLMKEKGIYDKGTRPVE